jgi:primosomal protein N' (replication factor Y)
LEAISKLEKPIRAAELLRQTSLDNQTLRALVKRGLAELREEACVRDPHGDEQFIATSNLVLNEEQTHALNEVEQALDAPENARPILLHGVTGSGKTEIYLQAIRAALDRGRTAIVLVPKSRLRRKRWNASKAGSPRRRTTSLFCTVTCPRANATTNGTKFIPVAPGS